MMRPKEEQEVCSCRFLTSFKVYCRHYFPDRELRVCQPELNMVFIFDIYMICKATFYFSSLNKQLDPSCISEIKEQTHF